MPRQAGVPNHNKRKLQARLERRYPNWHAVLQMADMAHDETLEPALRFQACKEVAKYVVPQLKAIELTGDLETQAPVQFVMQMVPVD